MKVLFAIAHLDKGGGQAVQCRQLVRRLIPRVDGELLALRSPIPLVDGDFAELARTVGDLRFPSGVMEMSRAIHDSAREYDLIQVFDPYYSLPAARLAGARPLVVRLGAHPVDDLASRYGVTARVLLRLVNPWLYSSATVVVNAQHLAVAFPRRDVRCIPNGVDTERFHPSDNPLLARRSLGLPRDPPMIAFSGKIIPRKHLEDLYWLLGAVPQLHLALAGTDREPGYGDRYRRRLEAEFPRVLARVHPLGELPPDRVPTLLQAANVFVFPSQLEGMPNAVLEAMASGLPVVAADTPAHRAILNQDTGVLYSSREQLASEVQRLLSDPQGCHRMGLAARRSVTARFGFDAAVEAYLRLYQEILARPGAS